jgi:hypothetical protein
MVRVGLRTGRSAPSGTGRVHGHAALGMRAHLVERRLVRSADIFSESASLGTRIDVDDAG